MRYPIALISLALLAVGCSTAPAPKPAGPGVLGATLVRPAVDVVPHRPDAAAYLPVPEHVWGVDDKATPYTYVKVQLGKVVRPIAPVSPPQPPVAVAPPPAPPKLLMVHFEFDRSVLTKQAQAQIDAFIPVLTAGTGLIRVDGFTDSVGTHNYNERLSYKRADVVRSYLVKKGVSAETIAVSGHADADPIDTNATEEGRADNRRTVIRAGVK